MIWYFLDACSLLNIYASGRLDHVAAGLGVQFRVLPVVYPGESQFIYRRESQQQREQLPVELSAAIAQGTVFLDSALNDTESDLFLEFAQARLGDGEAMTAAAVIQRGGGLVTDDRKARRIVLARAPQLEVLGTTTLLRRWAEEKGVSRAEVQEVLLNLEVCGNYLLGRRDPEWDWCQPILAEAKKETS